MALQTILQQLITAARQDKLRCVPGVYLLLRQMPTKGNGAVSVDVGYLTTAGSLVNSSLTPTSTFTVPPGLNAANTRQIANPVPGTDEIGNDATRDSLMRYYLTTHDRIVTPADAKLFCYNELLSRYGIVRDMVSSIRVSHRQQTELRTCGYEIVVEIVLGGNTFVKRSFADKIPQAEMLLEKMIEVRSANIYPVRVSIRMGSDEDSL